MIIRRLPTDFLVEESLTDDLAAGLRPVPSSRTDHAVYLLDKTSLTTPEAVQHLARALKLPAGRLAYAGLKDKHARTRQHITAPVATATPELTPRALEGRDWSATLVGWLPQPIDAAAIAANRFTITVRDATAAELAEMDRRAAALADRDGVSGLIITNFFGDQRFGSARHGEGFAARYLIRGEFEAALRLLIATPARKDSGPRRAFTRLAAQHWGDWPMLTSALPRLPERRAIESLAAGKPARDAFADLPNLVQTLAIDAYQSFLWNAIARRLVEEQAASAGFPPLRTNDDFGAMLFLPPAVVPDTWRSLRIPMPGPGAEFPDPARAAAEATLAAEGVTLADLRIPGLRRPAFGTAPRPLLVTAAGFTMTRPEPDELGRWSRLKRTLEFSLPRGAYATVVLRALGQG